MKSPESVQHNEEPGIQAFLSWLHDDRRPAYNADSSQAQRYFVPLSHLKSYLGSGGRIRRLLEALFRDDDATELPSANIILENYIRCFSILVTIGYGQYIRHFMRYESLEDTKLPFLSLPPHFPDSSTAGFFEAFKQRQWDFCAPVLRYGVHHVLDGEVVLPIVKKEKIAVGGSAVIYKVILDEEYDKLEPLASTRNASAVRSNVYVLKAYRTRNAERYYEAEKRAFLKLRNGTELPPNILDYYSSFIHGTQYFALLEYMDGGTLEQFMAGNPPPSSLTTILSFWDGIFGLLRGLTCLHGTRVDLGSGEAQGLLG